jgi:S1-C subfamily serine protease
MNIKHLFFAALALLISINAFPQRVTPNPAVDSDCDSDVSGTRITAVYCDDESTVVLFQYATTLYEPWIMINSKTYLTSNRSNAEMRVLEWGLVTEDADNRFADLELNEQYAIKRRTTYNFYIVFPPVPAAATSINIVVPAQGLDGERGGFCWRGIHINNNTTEDLSRSGQSKGNPQYSQRGEFRPSGSGSGFALSREGYVATCYHVVESARAIRIKGVGGNFNTSYAAKVVAKDEEHDIAILKIDEVRLSQIPYSCATTLSDVGEDVFVLGYPQTQHLGEELKLTTGVISSRSGYRGDVTTYQISAQALPGNSGGPLFDNEGRIIGVVNAKYIEPNVSYAVKSTYLKALLERTNIRLNQPVSVVAGKTLADKVKSIRNFIYIIEVEN